MGQRAVLLTRPRLQIQATATVLEQAGWHVIAIPLIKISAPARTPSQHALRFAADADWMIFTSRHAVDAALALWPQTPKAKIAAVGPGTARALNDAGWSVDWIAPQANSHSLLEADDAPDLQAKRVALMSGSGGRRLLKQMLERRGCQVEKLRLYRRQAERIDPQKAQSAIADNAIGVFTSGFALRQWSDFCTQHDLDSGLKLDLLVASPRLCKLASQLGFSGRKDALAKVSDTALLDALNQWNS